MMNQALCSLDLETLGTRPGDTILSIGVCLFDIDKGIYSEMHISINQESSKAAGLRAQKSTIEWWAQQSPEARAAAFKGEHSLETALKMFQMWLPDNALVYGNGANFDNALLGAAYRAMKMEQPWKFWNDRCYRTISSMFMKYKTERVGTYHNALDDAKTQALRLIAMAKESGFVLK
jgi:hypothetical protein